MVIVIVPSMVLRFQTILPSGTSTNDQYEYTSTWMAQNTFKSTLVSSSIGQTAQALQHTSLVGAFHGHAHSRLCQLSHLTTYVECLRIEDLETCEWIFSKSNALASATCYVNAFHHQQAISTYFQYQDDFETYANLSTCRFCFVLVKTNCRTSDFLYNNYKQALGILTEGKSILPGLMRDLGIVNTAIFETWLREEKAYLEALCHEPEEETLAMEYWQRLVKLSASA